jgi:hypothetical protein
VASAPALGTARPRTREQRGALIALAIAAGGVLVPIALAALGADYLAPRNLVGAMIAVTALIAVLISPSDPRNRARPRASRPMPDSTLAGVRTSGGPGGAGTALAAAIVVAFLAVSIDVDLSPRLQRGNWRDVARALGDGTSDRALTTVELGAAPLEYYLPRLHNLARGASVSVAEIDETGYAPLRRGAARPPAPGFQLRARLDIDGLIVYRFVSPVPQAVSELTLRRHVITLAHPEVLVFAGAQVSSGGARAASRGTQQSSSAEKT